MLPKRCNLYKLFETPKLSLLSLFHLSDVNKDQVCLRIFHRKVSTNPACRKCPCLQAGKQCFIISAHSLVASCTLRANSTEPVTKEARRHPPWEFKGKHIIVQIKQILSDYHLCLPQDWLLLQFTCPNPYLCAVLFLGHCCVSAKIICWETRRKCNKC